MLVMPGPNLWRLIRSDLDGIAADDIPRRAANFVRLSLDTGWAHELVSTGDNEWRIGSARPLRVLSVSRQRESIEGTILADRQTSVPDTIPSVRGREPWFVIVKFWWREPAQEIRFPGLAQGLLGPYYELNGAQWVLDRAVQSHVDERPSDESWSSAMGETVQNVAVGGLSGLAVIALLYLLSQRKH